MLHTFFMSSFSSSPLDTFGAQWYRVDNARYIDAHRTLTRSDGRQTTPLPHTQRTMAQLPDAIDQGVNAIPPSRQEPVRARVLRLMLGARRDGGALGPIKIVRKAAWPDIELTPGARTASMKKCHLHVILQRWRSVRGV